MLDAKARERAESLFDRNQKPQRIIDEALKQEAARYEAVVTNMRRLRALRLSRKHRNSVLRDFHAARMSASKGYLPSPGMAVCRRRLRLPKLLIRFPSPARPTFRLWSARYLGRLRPGRTFEIPPWESSRANAAPSVAKLPFRSKSREIPAIRWHSCALARYSSDLLIRYSLSESQNGLGFRLYFLDDLGEAAGHG